MTPAVVASITGGVPLLARLDPADAPQHPVILRAAISHYASVGDPHLRVGWTAYAHTASQQLHGPHHPITRQTSLAHAVELAAHGQVLDAYRLHQHRLTIACTLGLGDPGELTSAYRHLAAARHAISQCDQAATDIHHAMSLSHTHHQPAGEGSRILAGWAVILAGRGQTHTAMSTLRTYPDLLPATSTTTAALATQIVTAQNTHPLLCRRHPTRQPPTTAPSHRYTDWHTALHHLTGSTPSRIPPAGPDT